MLAKKPGFTAVAVLTLALGIAINASIFSFTSAYLLRRPPVNDPGRVAVVSGVNPASTFLADTSPVSSPNYLAWRDANDVFSETAAADEFRNVNIVIPAPQEGAAGPGQPSSVGDHAEARPESLISAAVSTNYFRVLGVSPLFGRSFADGEDQPGRDRVVILSHDLWQTRFASDRSVIGRGIRLNRQDYTVVGVMPANFHLLGFIPKLWTPLALDAAAQTPAARKDRSLYLFGRLKPGVTIEQARSEFGALAARAGRDFPDIEKGWGANARTLEDFLLHNFSIRSGIAVLTTAVGFVLLIACANVAGLLLARAAGRRKELAIRISLGASRLRIARQLLTEGFLIALLGGTAGLVLSYWGINFMRAGMTFNEYTAAVPLTLDRNVLIFGVAISIACALLCGLAPAWNASRTDVNTSLKDESRAASAGRSHSRLRTVLVTGEITLAMVLLVGTGILVRALGLVQHQDLGFRPDHLLTAAVTLDDARYKDPLRQTAFVRDVLARVGQIPGVDATAVASELPSTGPGKVSFRLRNASAEDLPQVPADQKPRAIDVLVSPDYFPAAEIPLLRGRAFRESDSAGAPHVVIVSEEFVRRFLKDKEPLGTQLQLDVTGAAPQDCEIVGIVADTKTYSEDPRVDPEIYESFMQRPVTAFALVVRARSEPSSLASPLREAVGQIDSELPLARVMGMPQVLDTQRGGDAFFMRVMAGFAVLALILGAVGIYGLIAYSVGQRSHEIAIRMAVGAGSRQVLRMILGEGLTMAAVGTSIGLLLALPLPKVFYAMFEGINLPLGDPRIYVAVPVAILLVSVLATWIPARRAAAVDPMQALRQE